MSWPLSQDYNEAIQDPQNSFRDPELRAGEAVVNALGLPMPRSGNFADVYEFRCAQSGNTWALKCFTRHVSGLQMRYAEISEHLTQANLPFTVDFTYVHQGIRVRGEWYPLLKMRWVEGFTLNEFVRNHLDKPQALDLLCQLWQKLARRLREANVAHADLQHGNVLLVPGRTANSLAVKLIDYDGMWVPTLASTPSGEIGHPAYQHPQRLREGTYSPEVDRFPHLVIYTALRALQLGGRALWEKYDNGDNLLFRETDLRNPRESALFRELIKLDTGDVRMLADRLSRAAAGPLEKTPLLDELLPEKPAAPPATAVAPAPPVQAPRPRPVPTPAATVRAEPDRPKARRSQAGTSRGWIAGVAAAAVLGVCGLVAAVLVVANLPAPATSAKQVHVALKPDGDTAHLPAPTQPNPIGDPVSTTRSSESPPTNAGTPRTTGDTSREPATERTTPTATERTTRSATERTTPPTTPRTVPTKPENPVFAAEIRRIALTPDGRQVLLACWDSSVYLWDLAKERKVLRCVGHAQPRVTGVACFADGHRALSAGTDPIVRLWDLDDGHEIRRFEGHTQELDSVAVSSDSRFALSCGAEPTVLLWDVATGKPAHRLDLMEGGACCVAFSPDSRTAFAGTKKGTVRRWDVETAKELGRFEGHVGVVWSLAFSADGRYLLTGGEDKTVRLWHVESGRELRHLEGHAGIVYGVALSSDGRRALSGSSDKTIRLWDVPAGKEVDRFKEHKGEVYDVVFSPDGRSALSGGQDRTLRLWQLPPAGPDAGKPLDLDDRLPVPVGAVLARAEEKIKEAYKAEYAKKKPEEVKALAARLLQDGAETKDRPADQFVLFREARDQAARAGDVELALRAVEKLAGAFKVDATEMKVKVLEEVRRAESAAKADDRTPVPEAAVIAETKAKIRETLTPEKLRLFEAESARKKGADVKALGDTFLDQALATKEKPAERYVLFCWARDLAKSVGDVNTALRASEELSKGYAVETREEELATLGGLINTATAPAAQQHLFEAALALSEEAKRADDYTVAAKAAATAGTVAAAMKGIKDNVPVAMAQAQANQVDACRKEFEKLKGSFEALKKTPPDPEASLAVGKFLCFAKGDWDGGLPRLAAGSDPALAALAKKDLGTPATANEQEGLAKAWLDQAAVSKEPAKAQMQRRAYSWYVRAVPELTGLDQTRVEKQIGDLLRDVPSLRNTWDHLDLGTAQVVDGVLRLNPQQEILTKQTYSSYIEVTLIARLDEKSALQIDALEGGRVEFSLRGMTLHRPDNPTKGAAGTTVGNQATTLTPNAWQSIRWQITNKGMDVWLNPQQSKSPPFLKDSARISFTIKRPVRLSVTGSAIDVKEFIVRPLP
jgi:WD40 repeat protein